MSLSECFSWLTNLISQSPKDPWEGCSDSFYVHAYRDRLEKLAEELQSGCTEKIYTRFNRKSKAAEIVAEGCGVLVAINIHGSEGFPYKAVISLDRFFEVKPFEEKFRAMLGTLPFELRVMQ